MKKIQKKVNVKPKTKRITIEFSEREIIKLESLAALTNSDFSKIVRACVRQSAGTIRKNYISTFVKDALAMADPFGEPGHTHSQQYAEKSVDDSDRELAEKYEGIAACAYQTGYDQARQDRMLDDMFFAPADSVFFVSDRISVRQFTSGSLEVK